MTLQGHNGRWQLSGPLQLVSLLLGGSVDTGGSQEMNLADLVLAGKVFSRSAKHLSVSSRMLFCFVRLNLGLRTTESKLGVKM